MFDIYRKLSDLLLPHERRLCILVFCLMLLVAAVEVVGIASIFPFMGLLANPQSIHTNKFLAWLYRWIEPGSQESFLFMLGIGVFVLLVGSLALKAFGFNVQVRFAMMRNYSIGCRLVRAYLFQPYQWFLNRHTSDLSRIVLSEVSQTVNGALFPAMQAVAQLFVVLFIAILLVLVDPMLALTMAVVLGGAYATVLALTRHILGRIGQEREQNNRKRFHAIQEAFGGIKDVKVFGLERAFLARFRHSAHVLAEGGVKAKMVSELPSFALQALVFGGMMLVLLYLVATRGGLQGALPVLSLYAFGAYRLLPALQSIFSLLSEVRFSQAALNLLHRDIVALENWSDARDVERSDADNGQLIAAVEPLGLKSKLELDGVTYSYVGAARRAMDNISLTVSAHTTIGLVGATGSGKTTAVDMILGLLWPSEGRLRVDGIDITADNVVAWRRTLGYVPQHIFLADDSIAANIAFGLPPELIDRAAVERAARVANLHDFVMRELPQGYDTQVGERGVRLSGGQRQRIGIARALYHDPEVLIMDEATSALDNLTERAVMEAVQNLGSRKTIILIAHRLTTVRNCDCIFLLDQGRVTASGTFAELVERDAHFRAMAEAIKP